MLAEGYLDPSAGWCQAAVDTQVFSDRDGDSFGDSADKCPDVDGPAVGAPGFSEAYRGCRLVEVGVTAGYADRAVSGQLSVTGPADAPAGACRAVAQVRVDRLVGASGTVDLGRGETTTPGGTYAIQVGDLPGGTRLQVTTYFPQIVVDQISACGPGRSVVVEIPDSDDDTVGDHADECPGLPGSGAGQHPGCPTLERSVTASYAAGAVSGQVVVTNAGAAPAGACTPAVVEVYRLGTGAGQTWVGSQTAAADGAYRLVLDEAFAPGTSYFTRAVGSYDDGVAVCAGADSPVDTVPGQTIPGPPAGPPGGPAAGPPGGPVAAPDRDGDGLLDALDGCPTVAGPPSASPAGCPTYARKIKASYRKRVVKGRVTSTQTVPGTTIRPCGPAPKLTVWLTRPGHKGKTKVGAGATAGPRNAFRIKLAKTPPAGAKLRVKAKANLATGLASCGSAQSPVVKVRR